MAMIEEPGGLTKYFEQEGKAVQTSCSLYRQEFELFCQLAELYERLGVLARMPRAEVSLSASSSKLFLVVPLVEAGHERGGQSQRGKAQYPLDLPPHHRFTAPVSVVVESESGTSGQSVRELKGEPQNIE